MSSDNPFKQTIQTYDQVADQYVERGKNGGRWDEPGENLQRFAARLTPGARLLDLGCGPGSDTAHFRKAGFCALGLDFSTGMLNQARQYVGEGFGQADMRTLPVAGTCLDAVWMQASLLHLPRADAPRAVAEVYRVLRPGGLFYMSVKQGDGEEFISNLGGQPRYFIYYQPDQVQQLVTGAGLTIMDQWINETSAVNWVGVIASKSAG